MEDLIPAHKGIFEGTPVRHRQVVLPHLREVLILVALPQVVNDEFLNHIREGRCAYIRGDTKRFTEGGVLVNVRGRESKPKEQGEEVRPFQDHLLWQRPLTAVSRHYLACRKSSKATLSCSPPASSSPRLNSCLVICSQRAMRYILNSVQIVSNSRSPFSGLTCTYKTSPRKIGRS